MNMKNIGATSGFPRPQLVAVSRVGFVVVGTRC